MPEGVQGWDRYGYVNNNPVKYNDPSGHSGYLPPQFWPSFTIPVSDGWDIVASIGCALVGAFVPVHYESGGLGQGYIVSNTPAQEVQKNVVGLGVVIIGGSTTSTSSIDELDQTISETLSDINKIEPSSSNNIEQMANDVSEWVSQGEDISTFQTPAGDFGMRNASNTRRFRYDYNNYYPHDQPHIHLDWIDETGEWVTERVYPGGLIAK